jgi:hypothetical protein
MGVSISVPLNTMLADLDESLRRLLRRELSEQGFEGINIAFDAPSKEWSAALSAPTVDLFLYDLREAVQLRQQEWRERRGNGQARLERPPLRVECSYAVTAWARAVEDEHRILSHVLAVLYAHEVLVPELLVGVLSDPGMQRFPIATRIGQPKSDDKADFWNAVGGTYRVALDYIVTLSCEPGATFMRGREVRSATIALGQRPRDGARVQEPERGHHAGGRVRDAAGEPASGVWVALPAVGLYAETDREGRFRFARVPPGCHRLRARGRDGAELEAELVVPGSGLELALPPAS